MNPDGTLILKRSEVASLLNLGECIVAVEEAFRLNEEGESLPPGVLETLTGDSGFHIKAAGLKLAGRTYYAAKVNANFPQNMGRRGLPTIQGVIALYDGESGGSVSKISLWVIIRPSRSSNKPVRSIHEAFSLALQVAALRARGHPFMRPVVLPLFTQLQGS